MTGTRPIQRLVCAACLAVGLCTVTRATTFSIKPVTLNPTCVRGPTPGWPCVQDSDCDSWLDAGDGICEGVAITFTCMGGRYDGEVCASSADCDSTPGTGDGVCGPDAGHQVRRITTCRGGPHDGQSCDDTSECESTPGTRDGVCAGDYEISALPGDMIITEIQASDWSPNGEGLAAWEATIDLNGFFSGGCGTVLPLGWDRPRETIRCSTGDDCPEGLFCQRGCMTTLCAGRNHRADRGAFVVEFRPDYVLYGPFAFCDPCPCHYADEYWYRGLGACYAKTSPCPVYQPPPKYCGTLALEISSDACGAFTIPFVIDSDPDSFPTGMYDAHWDPILPLLQERLLIDTGPIPPRATGWVDPPNCAIDARQPRAPANPTRQGWTSITMQFEETDDLSLLRALDFSLRRVPENPPVPVLDIDHIDVDNVTKTVTVVFTGPATPGRWTCVEYRPRDQVYCIGSLPGDVDNGEISTLDDVSALIDHLIDPDQHPLEKYQCDIDRSGACRAADPLRLIDVLNGGDPYDRWLDSAGLVPCPSSETTKAHHPRSVRWVGD